MSWRVEALVLGLPEMPFEIDTVFVDEPHALFFQKCPHHTRMPPGPATGQLAVAVDHAVGDRGDVGRCFVEEPADQACGAGQACGTGDAATARKGARPVYRFGQREPVLFEVYDRSRLGAGDTLAGPAIIEEPSSTTILLPGDRLRVGEYGELLIEVGEVHA